MDAGPNRAAVVAAFLAPIVGLPLIGPWLLYAVLSKDSSARPHVARAFDLQLATLVAGFLLLVLGSFLLGYETAEIVVGAFTLLALIADLLLLIGILRGALWSTLWKPVVLSHHSFYHQQPFVR